MLNLEIINYGSKVEETISMNSYVSCPIESLRYSKYIDDRSIALEYIDSEEVNSKENLAIEDLSWLLPKNNINFFNNNQEFEIVTGSFYSEYKDIVLTNKVTVNIQNEEVPLYYKHKRKIKEASIHCVKSGDNFVVSQGVLIQDGFVYTNYKNYFEEETGKHILYYISGVDTEGNSFNELLDLIPVIKEATWEDVDLDSGELDYDTYTKDKEGDGYRYNLTLENLNCGSENTSDKIYAKGLDKNLIKMLRPEAYSLRSDWIVRVQNGSIIQDGRLYKLPEYNNQAFDPEYGIIHFRNKECFKVNSNVIKLPVKETKISPKDFMYISVFVHDSEGQLIKAVTTNQALLGSAAETGINYEEGVSSWDQEEGFVEVDFSLMPTQIITANFHYRAESFLVKGINLNPFFNEKVIYNKYFFYVKPFKVGMKKALEWLLLDEDDRVVEASEEELKLEIDRNFNQNTVIGYSLDEFKNEYCYGFENNNKYMQLSEVFLEEDFYLDEISNFDIREKTSTKEINYEPMINRQWKILQSRFGYGNLGQVIQKNNVLFIEVPYSLLSEFTEEEVALMLRKQLPATLEIVIEFVYLKSKIEFNNENAGEVSLNISWEGPGEYKIYKSQVKIKRDESEIIQTITSSEEEVITFLDENVDSEKTYYYWVRVNENPYSNTYGVRIRWALLL